MTCNEPQFLGHFPGNPVFPGVLMIEGMAQTAGALCAMSRNMGDGPKKVFFMTIDKAKFRKPVVPGDTVEYHMTKIAHKRNMWWYRGEAKVAGAVVAEAEVGAMVSEHGCRAARKSIRRPGWIRKRRSGKEVVDRARIAWSDRTSRSATAASWSRSVHVTGHTTIGARTRISPFASLGGPPQSIALPGRATTPRRLAPTAISART